MHRFVFTKLQRDSLKSIQLYSQERNELKSNAVHPNPMATTNALILLHRSTFLIQYSVQQDRPKKLILIIQTKDRGHDVLIPAEITMKNDNELMISDHLNGLWLADLSKLIQNDNSDLSVEVKYIGSLLGPSKALVFPAGIEGDSNPYLYYYLPRDGAVVRWNLR